MSSHGHDIAGLWVAFFSRCRRYRCGQGFHTLQLATSRDLANWTRLGDRKDFIGLSPLGAGAYDTCSMMPPSDAVVSEGGKGDELYLFYTAAKFRWSWCARSAQVNGAFACRLHQSKLQQAAVVQADSWLLPGGIHAAGPPQDAARGGAHRRPAGRGGRRAETSARNPTCSHVRSP